jgi:hypothetical protein
MIHQTSAFINRTEPEVLVLRCSDHRFQAGYDEFLNERLKLASNYDLLAIPGGPQSLTLAEYLPKFAWAGWRWFRFLLEKHAPKRIVLIAHQDCGWYKKLPASLFRFTDLRNRQEDDLRRARNLLLREVSHLQVELYFASWDEAGRVTITTVAP